MRKTMKKIIATVLTAAMAMSIGMPVFAANTLSVVNDSDNAAYAARSIQRSTSYEITANNVCLRATPSLSGDVVAYLQKGDIVVDLKETVYADGYTWVSVQCVNCSNPVLNGTPAWVASNYLREIG